MNKKFNSISFAKITSLIFVLAILILLNSLKNYNIPEVLLNFVSPLSFLLIGFIVLELIKFLYRFKKKIPLSKSDNFTTGIDNLFSLLIIISLLFLILTFSGVSIIKFFTSISIVAAAIAIISRDYLNAIISGFVISFRGIINIGDYVLFNYQKGRIKDITLLKTYIENDQGELIVINNDKAFFSDIINYSMSNKRRVNIKFEIGAHALKSIDEFETEMINQLKEFKEYIEEDSFVLKIEELKSDKILFILYYTISELEPSIEKKIRRQTTRKIVTYVRSNISSQIPEAIQMGNT